MPASLCRVQLLQRQLAEARQQRELAGQQLVTAQQELRGQQSSGRVQGTELAELQSALQQERQQRQQLQQEHSAELATLRKQLQVRTHWQHLGSCGCGRCSSRGRPTRQCCAARGQVSQAASGVQQQSKAAKPCCRRSCR